MSSTLKSIAIGAAFIVALASASPALARMGGGGTFHGGGFHGGGWHGGGWHGGGWHGGGWHGAGWHGGGWHGGGWAGGWHGGWHGRWAGGWRGYGWRGYGWRGYGWGVPGVALGWGYGYPYAGYADPYYGADQCVAYRPLYNRYGRVIGRRPVNVCS